VKEFAYITPETGTFTQSIDNTWRSSINRNMRKRSSNSRDVNATAAKVIDEVIKNSIQPRKKRKNPAAVALGRLGGLKGGLARAENLTEAERSDIARRAAIARWGKTRE
jgi:hypothetical protein